MQPLFHLYPSPSLFCFNFVFSMSFLSSFITYPIELNSSFLLSILLSNIIAASSSDYGDGHMTKANRKKKVLVGFSFPSFVLAWKRYIVHLWCDQENKKDLFLFVCLFFIKRVHLWPTSFWSMSQLIADTQELYVTTHLKSLWPKPDQQNHWLNHGYHMIKKTRLEFSYKGGDLLHSHTNQ